MKKKISTLKKQKPKQKLTYFESPPREHQPDTKKVGDETPENTTQSYAEDNVIANPNDNTERRSVISSSKKLEKRIINKNVLPNTNDGFVNRKDSEELNRHEDENNNNSGLRTTSEE